MNRSVFCLCLSIAISLNTDFDIEGITDYETEKPGLGFSVGYNGPGLKVTVYVYTMGIKTIPEDLDSSILKDHFKKAANDILYMEELGHYSNVKNISDGEAKWGAGETQMRSLYGSYGYTQRGRDCLSHLYLMGFRNHFLKVRFTYDREIQGNAEKIRNEFLGEFSRILSVMGEETQNQ